MRQPKQRATVHGRSGERFGRGFSREELRKAGLSMKQAVKLGAPVDTKRKTAREGNIEIVRALLKEKKLPKNKDKD